MDEALTHLLGHLNFGQIQRGSDLRGEVVEESPLRNVGLGADLFDGHAVWAAIGYQPQSDFVNRLPGRGLLALA